MLHQLPVSFTSYSIRSSALWQIKSIHQLTLFHRSSLFVPLLLILVCLLGPNFHFFCTSSSADRVSNEGLIREHLRDIMRTEDLDNLTSKMVRHMEGAKRGRWLECSQRKTKAWLRKIRVKKKWELTYVSIIWSFLCYCRCTLPWRPD